MKRFFSTTAIVAGALALVGGAPAKASNTIGSIINVTGYETLDTPAFGAATTGTYNYYTGPIVLDLSDGSKITVFCAALNGRPPCPVISVRHPGQRRQRQDDLPSACRTCPGVSLGVRLAADGLQCGRCPGGNLGYGVWHRQRLCR